MNAPVDRERAVAADKEGGVQVFLRRPAVVARPPPLSHEGRFSHCGKAHDRSGTWVLLDCVGLRTNVGSELAKRVHGVGKVDPEEHHLHEIVACRVRGRTKLTPPQIFSPPVFHSIETST